MPKATGRMLLPAETDPQGQTHKLARHVDPQDKSLLSCVGLAPAVALNCLRECLCLSQLLSI